MLILMWLSAMLATSLSLARNGSDQIIIKYKDTDKATTIIQRLQNANPIANKYGVSLNRKHKIFSGATVVNLGKNLPKVKLEQLLKSLADSDNSIEYVEEDAIMQPNMVPNDPRYNEQWNYHEQQGGINLEAAWDISSGAGAVVAVVDTGYRPHTDLVQNIISGYDFISSTSVSNDGDGRDNNPVDPGDGGSSCTSLESSWHGTHVAGTIAAKTNNGVGVAGIAYNAHIVPVRVLGCGGGYVSDVADGIVWAAGGSVPNVPANSNPADVINLSLGGSGACGNTYQNAIDYALSRNSVVVVAAGNNNVDASNQRPANCSGVIAVAATNRTGGKAYYSNYGSIVTLSAPGGETNGSIGNGILSTLNSGYTTPGSDNYEFYQGTSMATPHVSGVAALMKSLEHRLSPAQIAKILENTARPFPSTCNGCGAGILRADQAVSTASSSLVPFYRYFNSFINDHFYTIDRNDDGYGGYGYAFETVEAYLSSKPRTGFVPLYRYWNPFGGDHFYTTVRNDQGYGNYGYSYEKIEGYVKSASGNGFSPLHRYFNGGSITDHFYSPIRNDSGYGYYGYVYEGIEGYVQPTL